MLVLLLMLTAVEYYVVERQELRRIFCAHVVTRSSHA